MRVLELLYSECGDDNDGVANACDWQIIMYVMRTARGRFAGGAALCVAMSGNINSRYQARIFLPRHSKYRLILSGDNGSWYGGNGGAGEKSLHYAKIVNNGDWRWRS